LGEDQGPGPLRRDGGEDHGEKHGPLLRSLPTPGGGRFSIATVKGGKGMFDEDKLARIREARERSAAGSPSGPDAAAAFKTVSGAPVEELYTPLEVAELDYIRDLGFPGEYPFTRGVQRDMYRGRLWTMRQFSGFGDAFDSNRRYRYLLEQGQTGLSVAFDMPTIMGYDSDHPRSRGEVGRCGVAVDSLADMEILFDGI